ncbi:MAG: hypothetical protein SPL96_10635 [Bacteroidales bacterium]|nr:hypothetical protein [Bacteroidales bacterium]
MLRKYLLFALLLVMATVTGYAGTWKVHSYYMTSKIQNVYDTGDKVYYLNCGSLFQFDKATSQTIALNRQNVLSDTRVSQIYYDWENQLLFVAYLNCNLDIIDNTGTVYNVSKLKDVVVDARNYVLEHVVDKKVLKNELAGCTGKSINDITFAGGVAYVTVDYGYVTIDETTKSVIANNKVMDKTGNVNSVAVIGNTMVILEDTKCYYGPVGSDDPINQYSNYSGSFKGSRLYPINSTSLFIADSTSLRNIDFAAGSPSITNLVSTSKLPSVAPVQKAKTGFIANFANQSFYYKIDETGKTATKASSTVGFATSYPAGDGTIWINDGSGLRKSGSTTSYSKNSLTTDEPYWLKYNTATNELYACTSALNRVNRTSPRAMASNVVNVYDGTTWRNVTNYFPNGSGYQFVFNPADSTTYFRTTWLNGIYRVKNNSVVFNYTNSNSKIGSYKAHPAFDNYGNMWVVSSYGNASCPVAVLPKEKVAQNSCTTSDWFQPSGLLSLNTGKMQASRFIISKKNNVKIYCDGDNDSKYPNCQFIHVWDNGNVDPTVDNYRYVMIRGFIDQTSRYVNWTYMYHMEEDLDGLIWVGTSSGLFVFDPETVFDEIPRAITPYVKNLDVGRGYLCEGFTVYDIGVDRNNNKWIATVNGLYFVSPDGTEVYNHFTTANSDIPSDVVYTVECDPEHDRVYIFTDNGFAEYVSEGDAAALNFDNVYAFPNPIEPDFTGMIKIVNLMEDSYVTITDRDGNIVKQMGPVMGSALWDGSGADGERVATGIYNIYAGQGGQPSTTGAPQASVMVIK